MKKILSLLTGMAIVLFAGLAFADDGMSDKMIRDEDLLHRNLDPDQATINQMPAEPGSEGSSAGGVSEDSDSLKYDADRKKAPVEKTPAGPSDEGSSKEGGGRESGGY